MPSETATSVRNAHEVSSSHPAALESLPEKGKGPIHTVVNRLGVRKADDPRHVGRRQSVDHVHLNRHPVGGAEHLKRVFQQCGLLEVVVVRDRYLRLRVARPRSTEVMRSGSASTALRPRTRLWCERYSPFGV